jgi:peptidoglycan/LPS O-acetylase OafA/YrhL
MCIFRDNYSLIMKLNILYSDQQYIKPLDGLRGVAIILVILFHNFDHFYVNGFGWIGVDLFFVLSGFLITRILLNSKTKPRYFMNFYMKRVLRIFPLYYLFVIGCFVAVMFFDIDRLNAIKNYFAYFLSYTPNILFYKLNGFIPRFAMAHLWSLAIEEHFYFLWPLMVFLFSNKKLIWISVFVIIASSVLGMVMLYYKNSWMVVYTFTLSRLGTITLGSLLAILMVNHKKLLELLAIPVFITSFACIVAFYLKIHFIDKVPFDFFLLHPSTTILNSSNWMLLVIGVFFASILCITLSKNFLSTLLSIKPLMFMGKYSYGIYVFHFPVFMLLKQPLAHWAGFINNTLIRQTMISVICVCITILLSLISYHLFEQRFLNLKKRFEK